MSYTITLTNGNVLATIPNGTINSVACSQTLVGKNYAGYGQFLDDNFVHLLENAANSTAPTNPLVGQLWFNTTTGVLQVRNSVGWKPLGGAQAASSAPTNNSQGDLWYNTTAQQLYVWTGSTWLLVGPIYNQTTGITGALANTIVDNTLTTHVVIELYVENQIVGFISNDATFTPQTPPTTAWGLQPISPGITLGNVLSTGQVPLYTGTATNAQKLGGLYANSFMRTDANTSTTGTVRILNNNGLAIGANSSFTLDTATSTQATLTNTALNGNVSFNVNVGGVVSSALFINGSTGIVSSQYGITANYADVAERFEADTEYTPGTVVELGGSAEITKSNTELSDSVFGVISTQAAYLMNNGAGNDATHPPVAMTGRVPVQVTGIVNKGDRLVSAGNGMARAAKAGEATAFNVIGRSLVDKLDSGLGTVEAIVTIK
jgi:hypothetical protein